jgi:hypothetical protein
MTRREWATMLGTVCSPSFPADAVEAMVDMLPLLKDFPDRAFNADTVNLIGRMRRRQSCPALDEVSAGLSTWCRETLPPGQRLGANPDTVRIGHEPPKPDPKEKARVGEGLVLLAAEIKREISNNLPESAPKAHHLSKLQLARSASAKVLALRPDLREVLEMAEMQQ